MILSRDGAKVPGTEMTGVDTLPPGGIDEVAIGIAHAKSSGSSCEIFIDDVMISTSPIGCD